MPRRAVRIGAKKVVRVGQNFPEVKKMLGAVKIKRREKNYEETRNWIKGGAVMSEEKRQEALQDLTDAYFEKKDPADFQAECNHIRSKYNFMRL